jgi:hypothetical protein
VDDLVDGLVRLMETGNDVTGPMNLGNPAEFTIRELAELVIRMTGSRSRLVFRPLPADDPRQRRPDIARARALLGWEPATPLEEGLARTIAYFRLALGLGPASARTVVQLPPAGAVPAEIPAALSRPPRAGASAAAAGRPLAPDD